MLVNRYAGFRLAKYELYVGEVWAVPDTTNQRVPALNSIQTSAEEELIVQNKIDPGNIATKTASN